MQAYYYGWNNIINASFSDRMFNSPSLSNSEEN